MVKIILDTNKVSFNLDSFKDLDQLIDYLKASSRLNKDSIKKVLSKNGIDGKSFGKRAIKKIAKSEKSNTDNNGAIDKEAKK